MKKVVVAACAIALTASAGLATTMATGQNGGAPESGSVSYEVVTKFRGTKPSPTSNPGVNPAFPRDANRQNAADMQAFHAKIFIDGKRAGSSHAVLTWTRLGKGRQARGEAHIIKVVDDFGGNDSLVYEGLQVNDPRDHPLAVVGGTGKYAGADGTAEIEEISFAEKTRTLRERITVTFTP